MKITTLRSFGLGLLLSAGIVACDKVGQDALPPPIEESIDLSETELVALPDRQVAVDLRNLTTLKTATTFTITGQPGSGEAKFAQDGLLIYTPNADFMAGNDEITISSNAEPTGTVIYSVQMAPDSSKIPCRVAAVPERVEIATNATVKIDVLKNDKVCDGQLDASSLAIESQPKSGTARVENGQVTYVPNPGFTGRDTFVYKVCQTDAEEPRCYLAAVVVIVSNPVKDCKVLLRADYTSIRQRFVTDSLVIPVQLNDQLCNRSRSTPITISKAPTIGTAYTRFAGGEPIIIYKPKPGATDVDAFTYQRCENGNCLTANVSVKVRMPDPACQMLAVNDQRTILLSKPDAAFQQGFVIFPVLLNDRLCRALKSVTIQENPNRAALTVLSDGSIILSLPNNPAKGTIRFTYRLTDDQDKTVTAQVTLAIKD